MHKIFLYYIIGIFYLMFLTLFYYEFVTRKTSVVFLFVYLNCISFAIIDYTIFILYRIKGPVPNNNWTDI